jgi:hypothetical protein
MAPETQDKVQLRRADFKQQMGVPRKASDEAGVVFTYIKNDG